MMDTTFAAVVDELVRVIVLCEPVPGWSLQTQSTEGPTRSQPPPPQLARACFDAVVGELVCWAVPVSPCLV